MNTKYILALTSMMSCFTAHAAVYSLAGPVVNPANGHSYFLLSTASWTDSEAYAQTLSGHLATVNDLAENNWIFTTFPALTGDANTGLLSLWIGLNDVVSEGSYVWSSGAPVGFTNWYPGQPDGIDPLEDYVTIRPPASAPPAGSWNDLQNSGGVALGHVYGVVEVVPEPSTFALAGLAGLGFLAFRKSRLMPIV